MRVERAEAGARRRRRGGGLTPGRPRGDGCRTAGPRPYRSAATGHSARWRRAFSSTEEYMRIGHGYDSHRFAEGRRLILGGVEIPHDRGLDGHSDADAVAHAVTDALLGAAGLGDIGRHFPPSDAQWKDADSLQLLARVVRLLEGRNYQVVNVDVTVVCEAPQHRAARGGHAAAAGVGAGDRAGPHLHQGQEQRGDGMDWPWRGNCRLCRRLDRQPGGHRRPARAAPARREPLGARPQC